MAGYPQDLWAILLMLFGTFKRASIQARDSPDLSQSRVSEWLHIQILSQPVMAAGPLRGVTALQAIPVHNLNARDQWNARLSSCTWSTSSATCSGRVN